MRSNILTGLLPSIFPELLLLAVRNAMESLVLILRSVTSVSINFDRQLMEVEDGAEAKTLAERDSS